MSNEIKCKNEECECDVECNGSYECSVCKDYFCEECLTAVENYMGDARYGSLCPNCLADREV